MWDLISLQHQEEPLDVSAIDYIAVRVAQWLDTISQSIHDFYAFGTFPGTMVASIVVGVENELYNHEGWMWKL